MCCCCVVVPGGQGRISLRMCRVVMSCNTWRPTLQDAMLQAPVSLAVGRTGPKLLAFSGSKCA
jgi:hypothetical protein